MTLLEATEKQLEKAIRAGHSLRAIAEGCDGRFNYEWLKKFAQGRIKSAGVDRVESLHARLRELDS